MYWSDGTAWNWIGYNQVTSLSIIRASTYVFTAGTKIMLIKQ